MTQAVTAGGTQGGENVAYVEALLGNLLLMSGQVQVAQAYYGAALVDFPGLAAAEAGQAQVLVSEGRPGEAAALLDHVVRVQPLAQYAISEGDDWAAAGQAARAAEAYALVGAIERGDLGDKVSGFGEGIVVDRNTAAEGPRDLAAGDGDAADVLSAVIVSDEVDELAVRGKARDGNHAIERKGQDLGLATSR